MWFSIAAIFTLILIYLFYRSRQQERSSKEDEVKVKIPKTSFEVSSDIGVPLENLDPERAAAIDRLSGVARPRVQPGSEARSSTQVYKSRDGLKERVLRKDTLSKEVELAWEAGDLIELQPGAWAKDKGYPGLKDEIEKRKALDTSARTSEETRETPYVLPRRYGVPRFVLMARDPDWLFAYWEVTHEKYKELYERHIHEWNLSKPVIRIYDITPGVHDAGDFNVEINDEAQNWYIKFSRPRHLVYAELGRLFPSGFVPLLRSNQVLIPADSFSPVISEEWLPLNWQGYAFRPGISSPWVWKTSQRS